MYSHKCIASFPGFSVPECEYEKFQPGKDFAIFAVLWLFAKFSPRNLGVYFLGAIKANNLREYSLRKLYFSSIRKC